MISLSTTLVSELHPTLNGSLDASKLSAGSHKKVWWQDALGHEWEARVDSRTAGNGCPFCGCRLVLAGFNDLKTKFPTIAGELDETKSGITASEVLPGSGKKLWWNCPDKNHSYETSVTTRTKGSNCPVCAGRLVISGSNDLLSLNPKLAKEWDSTKNSSVTPSNVSISSRFKAWWKCEAKGHSWEARVDHRSAGSGCPFCSGLKIEHNSNESLAVVNPTLVTEWHPTKNLPLTPETVRANSGISIAWIDKLGHEWETTIGGRTRGRNCPICAGQKVLSGYNDLATLYPNLVKEWDFNENAVLPSQIMSHSKQLYAWKCEAHSHNWMATADGRTSGRNCPVCAGQKIDPLFNSLQAKNPVLASEWHPTKNGTLLPSEVASKTSKKVWWLGSCGHEWETSVGNRSAGSGCPLCSVQISKTEQEIADYLTDLGLLVEQSNRTVLNGREIDIYLPEQKFGIEFNGLYWHSEDKKPDRNYHYDKWLAAQEAGIQLVQIWEDDWNRDKNIILNGLKHKLGLSNQKKVFARKTITVELTTSEAQVFLEANHIQGFSNGSYYLGLKSREDDKIKAVLVLKKEAGTEGKALNIIRYATSANVVGGFTKLLSYATKAYSPESYLTFSDHCISDGGLYANNGFIADKELAPDYMYVVDHERKHKFGYRLKRFKNDPNLLWEEGLTERELALLNGLPRIWDAGKTRWVKRVTS